MVVELTGGEPTGVVGNIDGLEGSFDQHDLAASYIVNWPPLLIESRCNVRGYNHLISATCAQMRAAETQ